MSSKKSGIGIVIEKPTILKQAVEYQEKRERKTPGRKKLPEGEKLRHTVSLKLNDSELANFTEKAGSIPLGTFLRIQLYQQTNLLREQDD